MSSVLKMSELKAGMVIVRVVAQNGPVKIRKSGLVSSTDMVRGLAEMGVLEVEIDPAQTVEIDAPVIEKSQTQKLLDRDYSANAKVDHSISEQFNRSLFLPSVQDIPSVWQYYAKQALVVLLIVSGGFGIGWSAANHESWLAMFNTETPGIAVTNTAPPKITDPAISAPKVPVVNHSIELVDASDTTSAEVESPSDNTELASNEIEEEGITLNQTPQDPAVNISPELLQRFESALAEVDRTPPQDDYETEVVSLSGIPKVHELPARILTRLPSMAFSAHMYASNDDERWVRVNGKRLREGEFVEDGLRVVKIESQHVIMSFRDEEFIMAALTDW